MLVLMLGFNAGFDAGQINGRWAIVHQLDFKARGNDERGLPGKAGDKVGWSGRQAVGRSESLPAVRRPLQ